MQLFLKGLHGETASVTVTDDDSVEALKSATELKFGVPACLHQLAYAGKRLDSNRSISSYGLESDSTVSVVLPLVGGKNVFGFEFTSLDNGRHKEFSSSAPDYRVIAPGMNIEGKCTNPKCEACGKLAWANLGYNYSKDDTGIKPAGFNVGIIINQVKCPLCDEVMDVDTLKSCGFYKCNYNFEGYVYGRSGVVRGQGKSNSSEGFEYHDGKLNSCRWTYLKISVSPPGVRYADMAVRATDKGVNSNQLEYFVRNIVRSLAEEEDVFRTLSYEP